MNLDLHLIRGFFSPHGLLTEPHLGRFSRFAGFNGVPTHTDRQTTLQKTRVVKGRMSASTRTS